ncbi:MAG: 5-(carboxyamino)imidazole ribonucleotide synthase [Chloroflexi bacterium]|nr:5-(carboxyamino)imidazole ribonucleotide synthase [Chloroflexota bacterium]MDA1240459.1 5-(carboxyamino)imidazole ribonucleotide synthase [Chloroflexota bacterium]
MTPDGFPVVGIVGAGQLARMMIQAAIPLGIGVRVLAERADDSAARVCPDVVIGSPDSAEDLLAFSAGCDVVTLDHELVNLEALERIEAVGGIVRPGPFTLRFAKDKAHQRREFSAAGLPVPEFAEVESAADIEAFAGRLGGWPVVVKAQRGGYDGRGVWVVDGPTAAADLAREAASRGVALIAERFVRIRQELAVLIARRPGGETAVYPVVETVQRDGICHEVLAPAPVPPEVAARALAIGRQIAELTQATGIVATELFWSEDGELLINEIATRPHNSGHFSIDGAQTSQFANHLRGALDWPLGDTSLLAPYVVMANLLGADSESLAPRMAQALMQPAPGVHPHLYGKGVRPGRKIGHVNALGDDPAETRARAVRAAALLTGRTE